MKEAGRCRVEDGGEVEERWMADERRGDGRGRALRGGERECWWPRCSIVVANSPAPKQPRKMMTLLKQSLPGAISTRPLPV